VTERVTGRREVGKIVRLKAYQPLFSKYSPHWCKVGNTNLKKKKARWGWGEIICELYT
jgi:hypothetical protein